jgi:hypothetical protein
MDKTRIIILSLAVVVIIGFSLYSFGSYSTSPKAGTKIQPVRISASAPAGVDNNNNKKLIHPQQGNANSTLSPFPTIPTTAMSIYENRDKPENYYSIQFPRNVVVEHGKDPGSYIIKLPSNTATFSVGLLDVPDTSNVQLYMLTQDEPSLKSSLQHYKLIKYNQLTIGGNRAWNLVYTWQNSTIPMESVKTFVEGSDNAAVITASASGPQFTKNSNSLINQVVQSFRWLGK